MIVLILKCRVGSRDVKAEVEDESARSGKFFRKWKLEAVKGYRFHFNYSYQMSKLERGAIFKKISDN